MRTYKKRSDIPENKEKIFKSRMRELRMLLGVTQSEFAKVVGITQNNIPYFENLEIPDGKPGVGVARLHTIVDAFKQISNEKSNGSQVLYLSIEDLFYPVYIED